MHQFQLQYKQEVLKPCVPHGLKSENDSIG